MKTSDIRLANSAEPTNSALLVSLDAGVDSSVYQVDNECVDKELLAWSASVVTITSE
jgi:hypothetical protein